MTNDARKLCAAALMLAAAGGASAQEGMRPEMSEFYTPVTTVVAPGTDMQGGGFTAPSDAIVLFDGSDLSAWENSQGGPAEWTVADGVMTVDKSKGDIRTKEKFDNFQLHIEWRVPENIHGEGQARGNSGVYLRQLQQQHLCQRSGWKYLQADRTARERHAQAGRVECV